MTKPYSTILRILSIITLAAFVATQPALGTGLSGQQFSEKTCPHRDVSHIRAKSAGESPASGEVANALKSIVHSPESVVSANAAAEVKDRMTLDEIIAVLPKHLNLKMLAGLRVHVEKTVSSQSDNVDTIRFDIDNQGGDILCFFYKDGATLDYNPNESFAIRVLSIYPKLPRGKGLGGTLFWLLLCHDSSWQGLNVDIVGASSNSSKMMERMQELKLHVFQDPTQKLPDIGFMIPILTPLQQKAVDDFIAQYMDFNDAVGAAIGARPSHAAARANAAADVNKQKYTEEALKLVLEKLSDADSYVYGAALDALRIFIQVDKEVFEKWLHDYIFAKDKKAGPARDVRRLSTFWSKGKRDFLREEMPTLMEILSDKGKIARFLFILSVLRKIYPFDMINGEPISPIAYAEKEGVNFRLGELYIAPVSESFRRHIIYTKDKTGKVSFAVEIKMPGEDNDRDAIWGIHFTAVSRLRKAFPNCPVVEPLFFARLKGTFNLYEKDITFDEYPLGVACFSYQDGKRLKNVSDAFKDRIAEQNGISRDELDKRIITEALLYAVETHYEGYQGNTDKGDDMHSENMRLQENGHIVAVADTGSYEYVKKVPLDTRIYETKSLLPEAIYPDFDNKKSIFPELCRNLVGGKAPDEQLALINFAAEELELPESCVKEAVHYITTATVAAGFAVANAAADASGAAARANAAANLNAEQVAALDMFSKAKERNMQRFAIIVGAGNNPVIAELFRQGFKVISAKDNVEADAIGKRLAKEGSFFIVITGNNLQAQGETKFVSIDDNFVNALRAFEQNA